MPSLQTFTGRLAAWLEQARMRRDLVLVTGRQVIRCWGARGDLGDGSFDRLTLALDTSDCLEIYSTALDHDGRRSGLIQLRRQDFGSTRGTRSHSGLVAQGIAELTGKVIARCRLDLDDGGDVLSLWPRGGDPATIRASAGARRGGLVLLLRKGYSWEGNR